MMRRRRVVLVLAFLISMPSMQAWSAASMAPLQLRLEDSAGTAVDPFEAGNDVRVFVFVRRDCPVSNRYMPELIRLQRAVAGAPGDARRLPVRLFLVYVDRDDSPATLAEHQRAFGVSIPALFDRTHAFAALTGATVTPEAAVFGPSGQRAGAEALPDVPSGRALVYRGRIDDRAVDLGKFRPSPTRHELRDAIEAAREGRDATPAAGPAVGCFIADAR